MPSTDIKAFQELVRKSKHIIAVAGAGLSAASGIPTFRGAGGMWRKYDAMSLATPEGFADNPSLVWQFYHFRREFALKAQPNAAHLALSSFAVPEVRYGVAPESTFTLITQNVDGLSPRADKDILSETNSITPSDPTHLIEMHGRLFDVICTSEVCTEGLVAEGVLDPEIPESDLPRCTKCGALARPGVVWFGESPHKLDVIDELVEKADLCLVVGTSSTVYPAASYAAIVQEHGGTVAVFNLERSVDDHRADFLFLGHCEEILPIALGLAEQQGGLQKGTR